MLDPAEYHSTDSSVCLTPQSIMKDKVVRFIGSHPPVSTKPMFKKRRGNVKDRSPTPGLRARDYASVLRDRSGAVLPSTGQDVPRERQGSVVPSVDQNVPRERSSSALHATRLKTIRERPIATCPLLVSKEHSASTYPASAPMRLYSVIKPNTCTRERSSDLARVDSSRSKNPRIQLARSYPIHSNGSRSASSPSQSYPIHVQSSQSQPHVLSEYERNDYTTYRPLSPILFSPRDPRSFASAIPPPPFSYTGEGVKGHRGRSGSRSSAVVRGSKSRSSAAPRRPRVQSPSDSWQSESRSSSVSRRSQSRSSSVRWHSGSSSAGHCSVSKPPSVDRKNRRSASRSEQSRSVSRPPTSRAVSRAATSTTASLDYDSDSSYASGKSYPRNTQSYASGKSYPRNTRSVSRGRAASPDVEEILRPASPDADDTLRTDSLDVEGALRAANGFLDA